MLRQTMQPMPATAFAVRPATPADIPALCLLKLKLLAAENSLHIGTASEDDWLRDGFGPQAKFTTLVAERGGAVIGMVDLREAQFPRLERHALFMHDLYVEDAYAGAAARAR